MDTILWIILWSGCAGSLASSSGGSDLQSVAHLLLESIPAHRVSNQVGTHTAKCGPKVARPITETKTAAFESAFAQREKTPYVILARPFDAGNVGSVARGMLNFGLSRLRLVAPIADHESDEAKLRASGAAPVLRHSETFDAMTDATADLQLVLATTVRPRERRIPVYSPREAVDLAMKAIANGERVGFLFGSEKNGLSNEELEYAHGIVTIPTMPGFSSLNLAQAALLMCYEWASMYQNSNGDATSESALDITKSVAESAEGATVEQINSLFSWWESQLWEGNFFGTQRGDQEESRAASVMDKLRALLMRARPSKKEFTLLRGALARMRTTPRLAEEEPDISD